MANIIFSLISSDYSIVLNNFVRKKWCLCQTIVEEFLAGAVLMQKYFMFLLSPNLYDLLGLGRGGVTVMELTEG